MNAQEEKQLKEMFEARFKDMFTKGMLRGSTAMCKVILDKANDASKTVEERIADIINFCETGLGMKKKVENK